MGACLGCLGKGKKERVTIPFRRRLSSRRARQEAIRKSAIDLNFEDAISETDKNVNESECPPDKIETQDICNIAKTTIENSLSFDQLIDSVEILTSANKERVKIPFRRRPSSRRARQDAIRKSAIDLNFEDAISENDKNVNESECPLDKVETQDIFDIAKTTIEKSLSFDQLIDSVEILTSANKERVKIPFRRRPSSRRARQAAIRKSAIDLNFEDAISENDKNVNESECPPDKVETQDIFDIAKTTIEKSLSFDQLIDSVEILTSANKERVKIPFRRRPSSRRARQAAIRKSAIDLNFEDAISENDKNVNESECPPDKVETQDIFDIAKTTIEKSLSFDQLIDSVEILTSANKERVKIPFRRRPSSRRARQAAIRKSAIDLNFEDAISENDKNVNESECPLDNVETQDIFNIAKTTIEKSLSFDQLIDSVEILTSANKERVKIPIRRRPSSRRARQEGIRKSAIDLNFEDAISENDKNVNESECPLDNVETQDIFNIAKTTIEKSLSFDQLIDSVEILTSANKERVKIPFRRRPSSRRARQAAIRKSAIDLNFEDAISENDKNVNESECPPDKVETQDIFDIAKTTIEKSLSFDQLIDSVEILTSANKERVKIPFRRRPSSRRARQAAIRKSAIDLNFEDAISENDKNVNESECPLDNVETQDIFNIAKTTIEKSLSFDQLIDSVEILTSANKERVKIPIRRRPSSRRARQEGIRKSAIDLNFEDAISENDKNVNESECPLDNVETQDIFNIAKTTIEKSLSFDQLIDSVEILTSANKERVKIPIRRRPSSRRARQEGIRKSAIDLNFEDAISENDKNVNESECPLDNVETQDIFNIAKTTIEKSLSFDQLIDSVEILTSANKERVKIPFRRRPSSRRARQAAIRKSAIDLNFEDAISENDKNVNESECLPDKVETQDIFNIATR